MRKKLNRKEVAFLASSALVLAVSGRQVFRREWDAVPVGHFHFTVAATKFQLLPKRSVLLTKRLHRQPRVLALAVKRADLVAVQATVRIDHEGTTPIWWGKSTIFPHWWLTAVDGQGQDCEIVSGVGTMKFDNLRQQYVTTGEFAVPALPKLTRQGHLTIQIMMNRPLDFADLSHTEAPIESSQFRECVPVAMPECLRKIKKPHSAASRSETRPNSLR